MSQLVRLRNSRLIAGFLEHIRKPRYFSSRNGYEEADYVVVGAGSAGSVVASRLADAGNTVILLEAGSGWNVNNIFTRLPTALSIPMHLKLFNWAYKTEPEEILNNRSVTLPRGRGIGGSSSINGMVVNVLDVYVRGHPMDFESWEKSGAKGWGWKDVAPYFKKMENFDGKTDLGSDLRGTEGPLHVKNGENYLGTKLYQTFIKAGVEAGYGETVDYNGIRQEGFGPMPATIFHSGRRIGQRCCAAAAYLFPDGWFSSIRTPGGASDNLITINTNSQAAKLLWYDDEDNDEDNHHQVRASSSSLPRVIGVECTNGKKYYVKKEVILSAGPIASPQLLQCSGVGDFEKLKQIPDIKLKLNLPGVGLNLMDHLEVYLQFQCLNNSLQTKLSYFNKLLIGIQWLLTRKGLGATNHFESAGFIRSNIATSYPDIQFHFLPVALSYDGVTSPPTTTGHSFQLHVGTNRSQSRGDIEIISNDIKVQPKVNFNYMSKPEDWVDFRRAIRLAREIISQPCFKEFEPCEVTPGYDQISDQQIDAFLKEHLESAYHPCGTCKMGNPETDPFAVVNSKGQLIGALGIRVIDSSIFPTIPNGNINAPTIMTAEKLSNTILESTVDPHSNSASSTSLESLIKFPTGWIDEKWDKVQRETPPVVNHHVQ